MVRSIETDSLELLLGSEVRPPGKFPQSIHTIPSSPCSQKRVPEGELEKRCR